MNWAANNGIRVINASLGGSWSYTYQLAVDQASGARDLLRGGRGQQRRSSRVSRSLPFCDRGVVAVGVQYAILVLQRRTRDRRRCAGGKRREHAARRYIRLQVGHLHGDAARDRRGRVAGATEPEHHAGWCSPSFAGRRARHRRRRIRSEHRLGSGPRSQLAARGRCASIDAGVVGGGAQRIGDRGWQRAKRQRDCDAGGDWCRVDGMECEQEEELDHIDDVERDGQWYGSVEPQCLRLWRWAPMSTRSR